MVPIGVNQMHLEHTRITLAINLAILLTMPTLQEQSDSESSSGSSTHGKYVSQFI